MKFIPIIDLLVHTNKEPLILLHQVCRQKAAVIPQQVIVKGFHKHVIVKQ